MATRTRQAPTADRAKQIRSALSALGIKATVSVQAYAYRVLSEDARALDALTSLGLEGPTGGIPVRNGPRSFFAYQFAGAA